MARKKEYVRLRKDSGQHRRIFVVGAVLGLMAFVPAALRLYSLMVTNYDFYRRLALENQSRVTRVMGERGEIYDRNMNLLAGNESVENVYLAPLELNQSQADLQALSQTLGELLEEEPAELLFAVVPQAEALIVHRNGESRRFARGSGAFASAAAAWRAMTVECSLVTRKQTWG